MKKAFFVFIFLIAGFCLTGVTGTAEEWVTVVSGQEESILEEKLKQIVSVDYKNTDIVNVLQSFAWTYKLNIVTSPNLKGKVTISLKDVTVQKALEAILSINGLAYTMRNNIIYVSPGDTEVVELVSEVIFLKYIKSQDARDLLRKVLSGKGDMKIDEVQNALIITDYAVNIRKLKELLGKIDIPPQQVLIEAKVVDITSTDLQHLGVTWNIDYDPTGGLFDSSIEDIDITGSMPEQSASLTGGQFAINAITLEGLTLSATIDALVRDGKANLLASPSIAVLNGQEARIIIGERYPIKERTQTTTGTTETTKFVDIGTTLKVTPQINEDGYITMRVHPEVSSLAQSLDAGPRITTREADTTVRIKERETLIIGGLIKQKSNISKDKIPILGDIPIIGYLFSRTEGDEEQKELAVFITPIILRSREEKRQLAKTLEKEEVFVNIDKIGELNLIEETFKNARKLDKGQGLESVRKSIDMRKLQAAKLYEHIYSRYPESMRAAEAVYSAGMIYQGFFKDYKKARECFSLLISDYSDSRFVTKAKRKRRIVERKIKRLERRRKR
ncbi:MAG: secretin and TonB N-terminal domain-containing protein [Candidatus Omnitrophota bacterium]|nr:MAG: secretin and TonB N-terminal domain-containing protein [Candidatus Omnitrophota bacterium]